MAWVTQWISGMGLWRVFKSETRKDQYLGAEVTERVSGPKKIQEGNQPDKEKS